MAENKERLDVLLVHQGFFPSREKARSAVMAGLIFVNGNRVDKPGQAVPVDGTIQMHGHTLPFVSRGGLKLDKAIKVFDINLNDRVVIDVGASTGGFTDCALQNGARKVYAVDVGYGQLAWKLRQDSRVVTMERTNIRYLEPTALAETPDFACIDVAFISLTLVLPKVEQLLVRQSAGVALIKPQFEAGREKVGKKGVVRDPAVHREVIEKILAAVAQLGWQAAGLDYSPVRGPEGNIEYLLYFIKGTDNHRDISWPDAAAVVQQAHGSLA